MVASSSAVILKSLCTVEWKSAQYASAVKLGAKHGGWEAERRFGLNPFWISKLLLSMAQFP